MKTIRHVDHQSANGIVSFVPDCVIGNDDRKHAVQRCKVELLFGGVGD